MKIGANISTYYRSQSQTSSSGPAILASTSESASQRTQAPTISIGGTSASTALSSALWLSIAGKSSEEASALSGSKNKGVADEFMEWSKMSPAEKIRAQILEEKGLSDEGVAAMDPDERAALEAEIKDAIKKQLGIDDETSGTAAAGGGNVAASG